MMEIDFRLISIVALLLASCTLHTGHCQVTAAKPHFVLVHGLGHGAWCWYKVVALLQEKGFQATAIDLASAGRDKAIADDIETIAEFVKPLTNLLANTTDKIILVGHSLGGVAVSDALEHYPSSILKAIFLTALMPRNNETAFQILPPASLSSQVDAGVLTLNTPNASDSSRVTSIGIGSNTTALTYYYYNKSPFEDVTLAISLLVRTPWEPTVEPLVLTNIGYGSARRFYIRTEFDNALPPEVQESIIDHNPPERVFYLNKSDHSAFFSVPVKLTDLLIHISSL